VCQKDRRAERQRDGQNYDPQDRASIAALRGKKLKLKCTKFNFCWDSAPDIPLGSLQRPPYLDLMGLTSRGGEGAKGNKGTDRLREDRGGREGPKLL